MLRTPTADTRNPQMAHSMRVHEWIGLEAVSQILPQQDHDATELDETQKIRNFVFMTGDQSAEVLKPSEQALDFPAAR